MLQFTQHYSHRFTQCCNSHNTIHTGLRNAAIHTTLFTQVHTMLQFTQHSSHRFTQCCNSQHCSHNAAVHTTQFTQVHTMLQFTQHCLHRFTQCCNSHNTVHTGSHNAAIHTTLFTQCCNVWYILFTLTCDTDVCGLFTLLALSAVPRVHRVGPVLHLLPVTRPVSITVRVPARKRRILDLSHQTRYTPQKCVSHINIFCKNALCSCVFLFLGCESAYAHFGRQVSSLNI